MMRLSTEHMFLLYHKDSSAAYVHGKKDVIDFSTMTKTTLEHITRPLFLIVLLLLAAACSPQAPIAVYITPTPPPAEIAATQIPASSIAPLVEPTDFARLS